MPQRPGLWIILTVAAAFTAGLAVGLAGERDETVLTVKVSSSEHELIEGYFTLGETATLVAKPGSDLFNFLSRQRGRTVRVTLTDASGPGLSRLQR